MKRAFSVFLIISILLSVICFSVNAITVTNGIELVTETDISEFSDWTKITDADGFKKIAAGGKYYLAANIDLTSEDVDFKTLTGGGNTKPVIMLDGCGYTVKTDKMLIKELPGGGEFGVHSEIRNLVIDGDIVADATTLNAYNNGKSLAALVGKANGGVFKNIVNNASVRLTSKEAARVAGIVGSAFNDSIIMKNCINNGVIEGEATGSLTVGVAGILGYAGLSAYNIMASLTDCVNNGSVRNTSTSNNTSFAGGIIAVKAEAGRVRIVACENNAVISAGTSYGDYYARSIYQNIILANDGISVNGSSLKGFSVVAESSDDLNATRIVDFVKNKYGVDLPIVAKDSYKAGDAIFVGGGNTYGGVRTGIDCDIADDGSVKIYLDESDDKMSALVDDFLNQKFNTSRDTYDFSLVFDYDTYTYTFPSTVNTIGYTYNPDRDKTTKIADGVKYVEKKYTTAAGIEVVAQILILDADADAHFEVFGPQYQTVSDCPYAKECGNKHIANNAKKTTSKFALEMESAGKNVLAAINADFFMLDAGCNTPWGMQIIDGVAYREPHVAYKLDSNNQKVLEEKSHLGKNWMGVTKDGQVVSGGVDVYNDTYKGNIAYGTGGSYFLIQNASYKKLTGSSVGDARTAIGYNAKGDIVLMVIDGNDKNNVEYPGANYADVAQVFMDLDIDITDVLMLDGGGSSNMIVENTSSHELELKTHIYSSGGTSDTYGTQRKVSSIIAIVKD